MDFLPSFKGTWVLQPAGFAFLQISWSCRPRYLWQNWSEQSHILLLNCSKTNSQCSAGTQWCYFWQRHGRCCQWDCHKYQVFITNIGKAKNAGYSIEVTVHPAMYPILFMLKVPTLECIWMESFTSCIVVNIYIGFQLVV